MNLIINETYILCPNPFKHPDIGSLFKILRENSRIVNLLLHVSDVHRANIGILHEVDKLLILCDSYPKLNSERYDIIALQSHGIEDIEILFQVIPGINDIDIRNVLEFCRVRGLHLGFINLHQRANIDLQAIISKVKGVSIGEECGYLYGCYLRRVAFYKDYPFQIISRCFRASCNSIYLSNVGLIGKCPMSDELVSIEVLRNGIDVLKCPLNPESINLTPRIKISLVMPNGVEIDEVELEILELIDEGLSIRQVAEVLGLTHTSVRKKLITLQKKTALKLLEKSDHPHRFRLTEVGKLIVERYREVKNSLRSLRI